jgi:UDP-glucose 4-epimerase
MRILIIGGLGFVGGRLAKYLSQAGHQIVLGSRHITISPDWLDQAEIVQIEWENVAALELSCVGVDVVIHTAGMNAQDCAADPVAALTFNGVATGRLVEAASRAGVKKFIYLSTAHVYSSPLVGVITEESCPRNLHPYATSHLAGEYAVLSASQRGLLQGIVLRLSNAFGAPMHKDVNCWMLLVNDLCRQAVETRKLVLQTSGLQHRDFICLKDVCRITEELLDNVDTVSATGIFNLGAGASQPVLSMAELIQQRCFHVLGFQPALQHAEGKEGEQHLSLAYRSDRLGAQGIKSNRSDNVLEVDDLLRFCSTTFTQNKIQYE